MRAAKNQHERADLLQDPRTNSKPIDERPEELVRSRNSPTGTFASEVLAIASHRASRAAGGGSGGGSVCVPFCWLPVFWHKARSVGRPPVWRNLARACERMLLTG